MSVRELLENLGVRRRDLGTARLLDRLEAEILEQNLGQLARRRDVERLSSGGVNLLGQGAELLVEAPAEVGQALGVDGDTGPFHGEKNR